nr:Cysteine/O-acetylserine efflux protein [Klebsiella pneumoniae]
MAGSADCQSKPATGTPSVEPVGFWASLGLQFVNVKIILYGITALSTFVLPVTREPVWLISVSLLLAAIGALGNLCWRWRGICFSACFAVRAATELDAGSVIGLLCCADRGGIKGAQRLPKGD